MNKEPEKRILKGSKETQRPDRQIIKQIQVQKVQNRAKRSAFKDIRGSQPVGTAL
ncbi:hypothetical protein L323_06980 [Ruminiclostridium papyrosolvens C7]|uniref:Uncharacterized protein n=1 Tax=Ruminiclostridium papyrosolvens C7 TaxID=1330534 RepID=U4R2X1_9FIRM|nr:hypothetical protein L323_06980 [Ruminiclostridium papyrosolvens C7]